MLAQLENWETLLACLETGIELHSQDPEAICIFSWQLFACGWARRARLQLESALDRHPEHPRILRELGRIAYHQFLWQTALGYWERCRHFGLISLSLEKLRRRGEAYHSWLRFLESGQESVPEIDAFRPCGYNLWNFSLRYDSLLLGHTVSDLRFEDGGWYFQADERETAAILRDFLTCARVAGWPIARVDAAELEDVALAAILAEQLGVPCGLYRESAEDEFVLLFSRSADRLASMQIPNGLTFALTAYELGPLRGDAPDVTGVAHERRVSFEGLSGEDVRLALEETPLQVFDDWRFRDELRPGLRLRPGWEERAASLPRPGEEELCERIRRGDRTALEWLTEGAVSGALKQACREALEAVDPEWSYDFLQPLMGEVLDLWEAFPNLRHQIFCSSDNAQALVALAISSGDAELRDVALCRSLRDKWALPEAVLCSLDLTDSVEARVWLRQQDREGLRSRVSPNTHPTLLLSMLDFVDASFVDEVRPLLEHPQFGIREKAARCLADWDQLSKGQLLALCETRYLMSALRGLARDDLELAVELAVAKSAFEFLREIGSSRGLAKCRALLQGGSSCSALIAYLRDRGEQDEEMLETALAADRFAAARALIQRGYARYWEVLQLGLESGEYDECAKELLDWGTPEALDTLVLRDRNPEAILHELPHHSLTDRVREMIPVAWRRLREAHGGTLVSPSKEAL